MLAGLNISVLEMRSQSTLLADSVDVLTTKQQQGKTSAPVNILHVNQRIGRLSTSILACELIMIAADDTPMKIHPNSLKRLEDCSERLLALVARLKKKEAE